MRELSLHILDIAQNSIKAEAECLRIAIIESHEEDRLVIKIKDDGTGMDQATKEKVVDPFYTSRTTRKVGLGIPMFKQNAEMCDGSFELLSTLGIGTEITAVFSIKHIDRVPLGSMADTIMTIVSANQSMDLIYTHDCDGNNFCLNTKEIRKHLDGIPLDNVDVLLWIKEYVRDGLEEIGSRV